MTLPRITRVQNLVAEHYGITLADLLGKDRHKTFSEARIVAMFLARIHLDPAPSYPELARAFGNRDHTTIMSAIKSALVRMGKSPQFGARVAGLAQLIGSTHERPDISLLDGLRKIELDPDWEGKVA